MSIAPTDAEVIRGAISARLAEIMTATIAKVVSYDPLTQTAEVQTVMRRAYNIGNNVSDFEDLPPIKNVPVRQPRAGGFYVHMPVAAGDHVLLIFTHDDIANWRETGTTSEPDDLRRHSLGSCVALTGIEAFANPLSVANPVEIAARIAGMMMGVDGGDAVLVWDGATIIAGLSNPILNRTSAVALADRTEARLAALEAQVSALTVNLTALNGVVAGLATATGNAATAATTAVGIFNAHVHPAPGGATSATATSMATPPAPGAAPGGPPAAFTPNPLPVAASVLKGTGPLP